MNLAIRDRIFPIYIRDIKVEVLSHGAILPFCLCKIKTSKRVIFLVKSKHTEKNLELIQNRVRVYGVLMSVCSMAICAIFNERHST